MEAYPRKLIAPVFAMVLGLGLSQAGAMDLPPLPAGASAEDLESEEFKELLQQGQRYAEFHQFDLAIPSLEKARDAAPLDIDARLALGNALLGDVVDGLLVKARLKGFNEPEKKPKDRPSEIQVLGRLLQDEELDPMEKAKVDMAEKEFQVALKLAGGNQRTAQLGQGRVDFFRKDWKKCEITLTVLLHDETADAAVTAWIDEVRRRKAHEAVQKEIEEYKAAKAEEEAEEKKK